jgi:hypothetical protein
MAKVVWMVVRDLREFARARDRVPDLSLREREHRPAGVPVLERDERGDLVQELVRDG